MRHRLILVILMLSVLAGASAQAQVRVGVKGGISFSTFVGQNSIGIPGVGDVLKLDQVRDGFAGGGYLTLPLARWFAIQPEVLYVQKGAKRKILIADVTWKVDYFEIPLLARLNIPLGPSSFYLFGGPALGFNTSSKIEASFLGEKLAQSIGVTRTADWSATAGAGFEVPTGPVLLNFDARYTIGISKVLDLKNRISTSLGAIDIPDIWDGRNGTILLLLGIGFPLGDHSDRAYADGSQAR